MKRVLMLGGSIYQTYAIKAAVNMGYYVITCDYLPSNPGHQFAHEYHNVSTTDKEAVLALAKELKVDGVVAYASDPAAPTAAYVSEKLGLPTSPYKSVEILSKKHLFRQYLSEHGFNVPKAKSYKTFEEAEKDIDSFKLPVMVKPVDSSGSKGINKMTDEEKKRVEDQANEWISVDLPVVFDEYDKEYAKNTLKAHGQFWDKYPERLKVYTIGDFENPVSREVCGGPHVEHTGVLGHFKIKKEESSSVAVGQ